MNKTTGMKQVTIDYIFRTSINLLFKRLSTPSGLCEWFVDDMVVKEDIYNFIWNKHSQPAKISLDNKTHCVRFDWLEKEGEYIEFKLEKSPLTKDITLLITDFVEEDEDENSAFEMWNHHIERLKRKLGVS